MKKLLIPLTLLFGLTVTAMANRARPGQRSFAQPDGTTLHYVGQGNEDFHFLMTADSALLVKEGDGIYIAETRPDGSLASTGILAHEISLRPANEKEAITRQNLTEFLRKGHEEAARSKSARSAAASAVSRASGPVTFPCQGTPRVLVLLVEFSDKSFTIDNPRQTFDKFLNSKSYFTSDDTDMKGKYRNYGSVSKYFSDMSFGKYTPQFDVKGPYKISAAHSDFCTQNGNTNSTLIKKLLNAACEMAEKDHVNFADYDQNNDGDIDLVYIVYAGQGQNSSGNTTDIWPISGYVGHDRQFGGKYYRRYGLSDELYTDYDGSTKGINGIGVFCHEFSHCLGLPDLYVSSSGNTEADLYCNQSPEYWSLMDAGEWLYEGYTPTPYTAWERQRMGWLDIDTLANSGQVTLPPIDRKETEEGTTKAYKILNDNHPSEYYIMENVQQEGWGKHLLGHGMMVWHVDNTSPEVFDTYSLPNSTAEHPNITILPADNLALAKFAYLGMTITKDMEKYNSVLVERYLGKYIYTNIYNDEAAGDPFPGKTGQTELTDESTPKFWTYYRDASDTENQGVMGKSITDIQESADGTISFTFKEGNETGINGIQAETEDNNRIFSLSGQYMGTDASRLPKGMYIKGQRKIIVR